MSSGVLVGTHIGTNATLPDTDESNVPNPLQCCALCTGGTGQSLYDDVARTQASDCPIFFLSYSTGVGWICQFYSTNATADTDPTTTTASIAYFPM